MPFGSCVQSDLPQFLQGASVAENNLQFAEPSSAFWKIIQRRLVSELIPRSRLRSLAPASQRIAKAAEDIEADSRCFMTRSPAQQLLHGVRRLVQGLSEAPR